MRLTDEDVQEFAAIWKEEFDEEISEAEARRHASQLIQLYTLLVKPSLPEEDELGLDEESHEVFSLLPKVD